MTSDPYQQWALVVVDAQQGFDDTYWGVRNNPDCDRNIAALVEAWSASGRPLVYVRHDGVEEGTPLDRGRAGNRLKPYLTATPDLTVSKSVNSAFHGAPDLHAWLVDQRAAGIAGFFAPEGMAVSWPFQEQQEPVPGAHVAQNTAAASISAASRMIRS